MVRRQSYFQGKITDVRLWDVSRSVAEIAANYNTVINPGSANLVGWYRFNDSNAAINSSTNATKSADGTYTGNASQGNAEFSLSNSGSSGDNWDGSTLIIGRDDAGGISEDANDQLAAKAGSSLSLSNGALSWSNTEVGTYTNSGGKLSITFNSDATTAAVQGVLRNLTYSHAITVARRAG